MRFATKNKALVQAEITLQENIAQIQNAYKIKKDAEEKSGNTIKTDTPKKLEKQAADRKVDKDNRELYPKQSVPVKTKSINEEVEKMKKMFNYNEKTQ